MDITYQLLCQRVRDYDFCWDDLAELMVNIVGLGDTDRGYGEPNPARVSLIKALRSVIPGLALKDATELVDTAIKAADLPDIVKEQATYQLQRRLFDDYHTMFVNGLDRAPAVAEPSSKLTKFGVIQFHDNNAVLYLSLQGKNYIWVDSIREASQLDLAVAKAFLGLLDQLSKERRETDYYQHHLVAFS